MTLITAQKENAIAAKLAEIFVSPDVNLITRPRQIISKQHFIANTTKPVLGVEEIRYLEFYLVGLEELPDDEQQFDSGCTVVKLLYRAQMGFQYMERRSDLSYSFDDAKAFGFWLWNQVVDNGDLIVAGTTHKLSRLKQEAELRIESHPIAECDTHMADFSFSVEVRA